jgi:hypothetical protein
MWKLDVSEVLFFDIMRAHCEALIIIDSLFYSDDEISEKPIELSIYSVFCHK